MRYSMHQWGDEDVDWAGINNAAYYISDFCRRWGRLGGHSKEKYGTVRFYANFGASSLLSLSHPGYMHYGPYPNWLSYLDIYYGYNFLKYTGVQFIFSKLQPVVYNMAYNNALKKWPHLRAEILCDADRPEFIKGATRREGKNLHILGWNGEILTTWTSS